MFAAVPSATLLGAEGHRVVVEVHVGSGLPGFHMVGLPDEACREARDRVRAAILSSEETWPSGRITVNLAPPHHRKVGSGLDLAIAVGLLIAEESLPTDAIKGLGLIGELGLDGSVRPVPGVAPMAAVLADLRVVVPADSAAEARVAAGSAVRPVGHLREALAALRGRSRWPAPPPIVIAQPAPPPPDLAEVRGQPVARRALEIAAAGGHHLLMVGPPGAGKTMLARRLPGILPSLDRETALEATMIHSAAGVGLPGGGLLQVPPFRAPHHSSSLVAMVGGGSHWLRPGEVSLSHGGTLFLDELGEFPMRVLDALRQPLEDGVVRVSRANLRVELPARFLLAAATNPCPCGGGAPGSCTCDETRRQRYLRRFSGPVLDRFDLRIPVSRVEPRALVDPCGGEPSSAVAARVRRARERSRARAGVLNADLAPADLDRHAPLAPDAMRMIRLELERGRLTGRGYHRVRRVARTIADLESADGDSIALEHLAEALTLRVRLGAPMDDGHAGRVA